MDWFLDCMLAEFLEELAVVGAETVGLSSVWDVLDGLLGNVLVGSVGWFPVGLAFVLLLAALSSSSDEMSTTSWADIIGCKILPQGWR